MYDMVSCVLSSSVISHEPTYMNGPHELRVRGMLQNDRHLPPVIVLSRKIVLDRRDRRKHHQREEIFMAVLVGSRKNEHLREKTGLHN